jgi:hypothetical protein
LNYYYYYFIFLFGKRVSKRYYTIAGLVCEMHREIEWIFLVIPL